jgi:hypothetical protein
MAGLSPSFFFSKPIRRLEPIERPAKEASYNLGFGRFIFWRENNVRNLEPCIYFEEHMYCRNPKIEVRFEILPFAAKIW